MEWHKGVMQLGMLAHGFMASPQMLLPLLLQLEVFLISQRFFLLTPSARLFSGPDGLARERDAPIERTAQRDRVR